MRCRSCMKVPSDILIFAEWEPDWQCIHPGRAFSRKSPIWRLFVQGLQTVLQFVKESGKMKLNDWKGIWP